MTRFFGDADDHDDADDADDDDDLDDDRERGGRKGGGQRPSPPLPSSSSSSSSRRGGCRCTVPRRAGIVVMMVLTFVFFVVELVVGHVANSLALVADAFHMLSDVFAFVIALVAIRLRRQATHAATNTFGWQRAEILGALVNSVFLLALCFTIFLDVIARFIDPPTMDKPLLVVAVGFMGLLINVIGMIMFGGSHGHSHGGHGHSHGGGGGGGSSHGHSHFGSSGSITSAEREGNSTKISPDPENCSVVVEEEPLLTGSKGHNIKAVFLHVLGDFLGSVGVVVSGLLIHFVDRENIYYVDPCISLFIVAITVTTTLPLLKETCHILLQSVPPNVDYDDIKHKLSKLPGIEGVHEFHIWHLADAKVIASIHVSFASVEAYFKSASDIQNTFHNCGIHSVTVQPEFLLKRKSVLLRNDSSDCVLACKSECGEAKCCAPVSALPAAPQLNGGVYGAMQFSNPSMAAGSINSSYSDEDSDEEHAHGERQEGDHHHHHHAYHGHQQHSPSQNDHQSDSDHSH